MSKQMIERAAAVFHARNPHVMESLLAVCLKAKRAGRRRWSIGAAFEVVRYNALVTTDGRTYKLNNNHKPIYARWIMRDCQELRNFFRTREASRITQEYFE